MKSTIQLPNISIQLDHGAITRAIFRGREVTPTWARKVEDVVRSVEPALHPAALCRWFLIDQVVEPRIVLVDPDTRQSFVLEIGEHVRELAPAERALCCVATLGAEFDQTLQRWTRSGEVLDGYLADCVGIYGLLQVSRAVYREVEGIARANHWGVGRVLCPGAIEGWSLECQQDLCALLPLAQIGVELNAHKVLSPARSVSFLLGIGPGYEAASVDSPCDICTNTGECWCKC
nr:hypothetical protein [uncultured Desulfobulbus sp.]